MIHLYIYTPLYNNKDFIPHLIEHSVFGETNTSNFFQYENIGANCSTYYSYYSLDTNDQSEITNFIDLITSPLNNDVLDYEYEVLKKECSKPSYAQKMTQKVGNFLYGDTFGYLSINELNHSEIHNYHKKYYKKENIIILENNNKFYSDTPNVILNLHSTTQLNIEGNNENIFIFNHNICEYYTISLLASLFDYYIKYTLRFSQKTYDYLDFYTLIGEFEDYFYISIHSKSLPLIKDIDNDFINEYIKNSLQNEEYLSDVNLDGSSLVKYGYQLSNDSKLKLLKDINNTYKLFISKI